MTFWQRSKLFSPLLVRLLARHKRGRPLTDDEIVKSVSGLSHFEVQSLSQKTDWDGVTIDTMQVYLVACGCDFESRADMKRVEEYIRAGAMFKYLQRDRHWNDRWMPMLVKWVQEYDAFYNSPQPDTVVHRLAIRLRPLVNLKRAA